MNTTQPSINSFTDLVEEFPVGDNEAVIETDDNRTPNKAFIPTGIEPAKRAPYKVRLLVVNITHVNVHGQQVWEPSSQGERTLTIKQLLTKIDHGFIMEKKGENYTVENSQYSPDKSHPTNAA